jgi:hypothetical protein
MSYLYDLQDLHCNSDHSKSNKKTLVVASPYYIEKKKVKKQKLRAKDSILTAEFVPADNSDSNQKVLPRPVAPEKIAAETNHTPSKIRGQPG